MVLQQAADIFVSRHTQIMSKLNNWEYHVQTLDGKISNAKQVLQACEMESASCTQSSKDADAEKKQAEQQVKQTEASLKAQNKTHTEKEKAKDKASAQVQEYSQVVTAFEYLENMG